jgi:hypothetical protein
LFSSWDQRLDGKKQHILGTLSGAGFTGITPPEYWAERFETNSGHGCGVFGAFILKVCRQKSCDEPIPVQ